MEEDTPIVRIEQTSSDAVAALNEMKRSALDALVPLPKQIPERIPLIGMLGGKKPNIVELYRAAALWEFRSAMRENRPMDWKKLDPVKFLEEHAPSIDATRAKQIVEIARSTSTEQKASMWGWGSKR